MVAVAARGLEWPAVKSRDVLAIFNRGLVSRLAVARTDVARVALSAETMTNWMPRTLGSMMIRPGLQYLGEAEGPGAYVPFIYSNEDCGIIELTAGTLRFWDDGTDLLTRTASTAVISNGAFNTDLTGWTDADEGSAASTWVSGAMQLLGTGYLSAKRRQTVTLASSQAVALRITVERGPVILRIGTSAGLDDTFRQAVLRTGTHSIAFTSGTFTIEFSSSLTYPVLVASCTVEGAGVMELPTPWTNSTTCRKVRWHQSADVVFCACAGQQQMQIERRPNNSWSIVKFEANDGPFMTENIEKVTLTPSAISGAITLTASRAMFTTGHVGALFRIASIGQYAASDLSAENTFTDPLLLTGVGASRVVAISKDGTWTATVVLQRSIGAVGSWVTVATWTATGDTSYSDSLDNVDAYYRLGIETGGYTSGTAELALAIATGSITGTARVTGYTSETVVDAVVLKDFGPLNPSEIWWEGAWSDEQGWPEAVAITEGRLWWSGQGRNYASVPDAFASYDPLVIGDSQPIDRRCGEGSVNKTNWIMPMQNLIMGTDGSEVSVRSTSFEEPITSSNYNAKSRTTKGSDAVPAVMADGLGYFVGKTGDVIYELTYDGGSYGYVTQDMMLLVPELGDSNFTRLAVQQAPDMRLHAVRDDGTAAIMVRDEAENVLCWVELETDGVVEDVVVLPGRVEDRVFYRVARVIDGDTVRYHEKWALERQAQGGSINRMADSYVTGTGAIAGLDHLEGETVVIWGDSQERTSQVVTGGACTGSYTAWCVGLPYTATYRSAKLAGQTSLGLSLTQRSRINAIGMILADTHAQGVRFGPDTDNLDTLPLMERGVAVDQASVWEAYDEGMVEFPGDWSTDNRVCLVARAPLPCTVLGVVLSIDRQDHD